MPGPVQGVLERAELGRDTWMMSVTGEQALTEGSPNKDYPPQWFPSTGATWGHSKGQCQTPSQTTESALWRESGDASNF